MTTLRWTLLGAGGLALMGGAALWIFSPRSTPWSVSLGSAIVGLIIIWVSIAWDLIPRQIAAVGTFVGAVVVELATFAWRSAAWALRRSKEIRKERREEDLKRRLWATTIRTPPPAAPPPSPEDQAVIGQSGGRAVIGTLKVVEGNDDEDFVTRLAGVEHPNRDGSSRVAGITTLSLYSPLVLVREPSNPHDENAIAVLTQHGAQIGYVPRGRAEDLAVELDGGELYYAFVLRLDTVVEGTPGVLIRIVRVDPSTDHGRFAAEAAVRFARP